MNINVIRLREVLDDRESLLKKDNDVFLDEINAELTEEDLYLVEDNKDAICNIFFIETGGSEPQFVKLFDSINKNEPVLLLSNCKNNSFPATLEIKTYCAKHNVTVVTFASLDAMRAAENMKAYFHIYLAKKSLENTNLGVIGEPSPWLIASSIDPIEMKEKFNINLIIIGMEELFSEINKKKMGKVPHLETLKKKWKNKEILEEALYFYGAIKRLVEKYHLQGLTIRCFDLLKKYHNTACLALALLNEEGITAGCEGDISSLLTMHILRALTNTPCFMANPSYINGEKGEILFAHCTLPLNMATDYNVLTHFESNEGIGIQGKMPMGEVTICKVALSKKGLFQDSIALVGNIKENTTLEGYCRTQIKVELEESEIISFLKSDFGNHVIITYGNVYEDFYSLLSLYQMNFKQEKE